VEWDRNAVRVNRTLVRAWAAIGFGLVAGLIFALAEVVLSVLMGGPPLQPFRVFASVVMGQAAFVPVSVGSVFLVGLIVHLILSGFYGLIYGAIIVRLSLAVQSGG
jgi:hypothetical protein